MSPAGRYFASLETTRRILIARPKRVHVHESMLLWYFSRPTALPARSPPDSPSRIPLRSFIYGADKAAVKTIRELRRPVSPDIGQPGSGRRDDSTDPVSCSESISLHSSCHNSI